LVLVAVGSAFDVESIVRNARQLAPHVHIVARATQMAQVALLHELGIHEIVQPEFEAGLEMMRQTMLHFDVAPEVIERMSDDVRAAAYAPLAHHGADAHLEGSLGAAKVALALSWHELLADSPLVAKTLGDGVIRVASGVLVVGILRNGVLLMNPTAHEVLQSGDMVAVCGTPDQRRAFAHLVLPPQPSSPPLLTTTREPA
jgi:CPA2 family monovalent cation:H+ antiporter-2